MKYRFQHLQYRRKFRHPLVTAHGEWRHREGIIIRLEADDATIGFGEIAPLPSFGTESLEQALEWCVAQRGALDSNQIIPNNLQCCQWAVFSAMHTMDTVAISARFPVAALVGSLDQLLLKQKEGYEVFKMKIAVRDFAKEAEQVEDCMDKLHSRQRLRLDANGGLSESTFGAWLEFLEGKPVEYLEQPLSPGLEHRMLEMSEPFSTPIALDESIAGMRELKEWADWPGPMVVKPSLLGDPDGFLPEKMVGSSVFETSFGVEAALQFLACHQKVDTAIGFDTLAHLEEDGWCLHEPGPEIDAAAITIDQLQALWEEKC